MCVCVCVCVCVCAARCEKFIYHATLDTRPSLTCKEKQILGRLEHREWHIFRGAWSPANTLDHGASWHLLSPIFHDKQHTLTHTLTRHTPHTQTQTRTNRHTHTTHLRFRQLPVVVGC